MWYTRKCTDTDACPLKRGGRSLFSEYEWRRKEGREHDERTDRGSSGWFRVGTVKTGDQGSCPGLVDDVGFASAEPFVSLKSLLEQHRDNGYASGFEEPDIEKRVRPALKEGEPASLIAIAVAYPSKMVNPPKSEPGAYRGILARSAWGRDYHHVLREAMDKLVQFIRERVPEAMIESMVDTGALVDRAVSQRAGIGFSAKTVPLFHPSLGRGSILVNW